VTPGLLTCPTRPMSDAGAEREQWLYLTAKRRMRQHAVVFVNLERDQSTDGGDAAQRVEEGPCLASAQWIAATQA
jgi:hypothetical protein